jgi:hypothetical protein
VSGSAVIQGSVTDLLDIESVIEASGIVTYEHGDMVAAGA